MTVYRVGTGKGILGLGIKLPGLKPSSIPLYNLSTLQSILSIPPQIRDPDCKAPEMHSQNTHVNDTPLTVNSRLLEAELFVTQVIHVVRMIRCPKRET